MREELDEKLVEKYPRMFRNRHAPMTQTCMCWGFDCGDGWYKIIDSLCGQIQHHIDWKRKQRAYDLRLNRAQAKGRAALLKFISGGKPPTDWHEKHADYIMMTGVKVPVERIHHVTVDQVKEKFGGLRFYYHGGDDVVDGMVRMVESWAANTCERCGNPGTIRHGGWISTLCDEHAKQYEGEIHNGS